MITTARITEIHHEAITTGAGKLTGKEHGFIESIYRTSLRPGFTGLSIKQEAWFTAIARKLEATKGKYAFQIIGEKHQRRLRHFQDSYHVACAGY